MTWRWMGERIYWIEFDAIKLNEVVLQGAIQKLSWRAAGLGRLSLLKSYEKKKDLIFELSKFLIFVGGSMVWTLFTVKIVAPE